MKERPILFSGSMVNAVLADRKTQTRRILKGGPVAQETGHWAFTISSTDRSAEGEFSYSMLDERGQSFTDRGREITTFRGKCPHGRVGDHLWVREAWALEDLPGDGERLIWRSDVAASWRSERSDVFYLPSNYQPDRWRPSIHMPRWASRIKLEVTGVRVERLQDITDADAEAEGVMSWAASDDGLQMLRACGFAVPDRPSFLFKLLWTKINGPDSWDANPWLWVVSFARLPS